MDAGVAVLVLNYNGRDLLAECLPAVVAAARASRRACRVVVVDNGSTDGSAELVAERFPDVEFRRYPNDSLCSFNAALAELPCRAAILLNNDIKPSVDAFDPLLDPLLVAQLGDGETPFMTAPRAFLFDGTTHEGFKTAVWWRRGLVCASALFEDAEDVADLPGTTASAGAALAVDREKFLRLGGFDRMYWPGRIEDLDFAFRGFMAGFCARYVPEAVVYHRGAATFGREFGPAGCDRLALRNTLLFQWKNLRDRRHRLSAACWIPARLVRDLLQAPFVRERFVFTRAYCEARRIWCNFKSSRTTTAAHAPVREREYFARHAPAALRGDARFADAQDSATWRAAEKSRDADYPLARWYLRPAARALASRAARPLRPWHLTLCGLACAIAAAVCLTMPSPANIAAAALILAAWFFDRADGTLARLRKQTTAAGAWLDANVDEAVDLGLHVVVGLVAAQAGGTSWPLWWLVAFLLGKYLLMYGMAFEQSLVPIDKRRNSPDVSKTHGLARRLYHLPANADVRIHLLALAAATGQLTLELAAVACYYNLRWTARYAWLLRRLARLPRAEAGA